MNKNEGKDAISKPWETWMINYKGQNQETGSILEKKKGCAKEIAKFTTNKTLKSWGLSPHW